MFEPRKRSDRPCTIRQEAGVAGSRGNAVAQLGYVGGWVEHLSIAKPLFWEFLGLSIFVIDTCGPRGAAYPFFASAFLVSIRTTREEIRGSAGGWSWIAFIGGSLTLGSTIAAGSLGIFGCFDSLFLPCQGYARNASVRHAREEG
jgi:hypothetical protein